MEICPAPQITKGFCVLKIQIKEWEVLDGSNTTQQIQGLSPLVNIYPNKDNFGKEEGKKTRGPRSECHASQTVDFSVCSSKGSKWKNKWETMSRSEYAADSQSLLNVPQECVKLAACNIPSPVPLVISEEIRYNFLSEVGIEGPIFLEALCLQKLLYWYQFGTLMVFTFHSKTQHFWRE